MTEELLCCRGLGKQFGHKVALAGVDLSLGRGRIIGLLGPNGITDTPPAPKSLHFLII